MSNMKKTFALLVGINNYASPVSGLRGCIKDIDQIESYLQTNFGQGEERLAETAGVPFRTYGPLYLCRLADEQATYHNILAAFRHFLRQAGPEDVAWFHFSGHGSEEFTAEEFLALEPNGKDQTLVCYRAKAEDGHLHLADKELAVLLHEVATQDTNGQPKASPHLVVSLDCCHSGSGTRDVAEDPNFQIRGIKIGQSVDQIKARSAGTVGRGIATYAGGYYAQQWERSQSLEVPESRHVLLSACESIQKAGDLPVGGIFTSSLITTLEQAKGELNYADLFVRTRATSRKLRREQTPQFETIGNFDPFTRFLDGTALGTPERYEVVYENGHWFVKCGAIHGLPVQTNQPIELEIQTAAPENKLVAIGQISGLGAQKSRFMLTDGGLLDQDTFYQAVLRYLPAPPVFVWLHGDAAGLQLLKDHWEASKNMRWTEDPDLPDVATLEVEAKDGHFFLSDRQQGRAVLNRPQDAANAKLIVSSLAKIVRWERTIRLDNPKSTLRQAVDFELGIANKKMEKTFFQAPEIRLYVSGENYFGDPQAGTIGVPFFPNVIVRNTNQPLYAYLLHLRSNYGIDAYEGEVAFRPAEHPGKQEVSIPMWKKPMGWGLSPGEAESTSYFKLLVTTEPLDYQQLLQSGIGGFRSTEQEWKPVAVDNAWANFTTKVTLVRAEQTLQADKSTALAGGNLKLLPHPALQATVSLVAASRDERSADPACNFVRFQSPAFQLVDFRTAEYPNPLQVLELTELEQDQSVSLEEQPLELELGRSIQANEQLVAVAFDGKDYRVIGEGTGKGDQIKMEIRELPQIETSLPPGNPIIADPFDEDRLQHRSLYQALKIAFFKTTDPSVDWKPGDVLQ